MLEFFFPFLSLQSFIVFNMNEKKKPAMINPAIVSEQMTDMFEEDDDDDDDVLPSIPPPPPPSSVMSQPLPM